MNDRELLEMAAKANWQQDLANDEVSLRYDEREGGILYLHADNQDHNGCDREFLWNPLAEDGDALRLAVKLRIIPHMDDDGVSTGYERISNVRRPYMKPIYEAFRDDEFAAARRAIVRAAAEIGKNMGT